MKKILLLSILFLSAITMQAQIGTVWSWNFDEMGISDETLGDWVLTQTEESTGTTWTLKNSEYNILYGTGQELNVLSSNTAPGVSEGFSRWAITPAVNLSFYTGTKIKFEYLKGLFEAQSNEYVDIYAATTPDIEAMLANGPIASLVLEGGFDDPPTLVIQEVDIPAEYNLETVYFAIVSKWEEGLSRDSWALEITEVEFTAESLGTKEVVKTQFALAQNPVADYLELQAGSLVNTEEIQLFIYNTTGALIKQGQYQENMSVADLQSGMYFLLVIDGINTEKIKFIKK